MNDFQQSLKDLMDEKEINRSQLGRNIGVSSKTIDGYFNSNIYPDIKIAKKLAEYFECSLDYLFGLSDIKKKNTIISSGSFIENFLQLIKENNTTLNRTMKSLKMSRTNFYRWKTGDFPRTQNIIEIAKYFNCSVDFLVGNVED